MSAVRGVVLASALLVVVAATYVGLTRVRTGQASSPAPLLRSRAVVRPVPGPALTTMTRDFAVPVLMYHHVGEIPSGASHRRLLEDLTVSTADFERQMRCLVDNGFAVIPASRVAQAVRDGGALPAKAVAITFDDGYQDVFDNAFPILRKYRLPATLFVVTGTVGTPGHVTWDELRAMAGQGIECGSHTVNHLDLTTLSSEQVAFQLVESRREIREMLGNRTLDFAYPAGEYNGSVVAQVRREGYHAAWRKEGGPVKPGDDLYLLPRMRVSGREAPESFCRTVGTGD
jgi:peptidoglycan/xylan/chitin deacetylase (PgdA/CDA1 family)